MKFILHRDPDSKSQKIPYAALQISALAGAAELAVEAGNGYILVCRNELTVREAVSTIAHLNAVVDSLMEELVSASREAAGELEDDPDPLDELDEEVLDDLLAYGADWKVCASFWRWRRLRMNDVYLYPYSAEEARRRDELSLWRASYQENIACKIAIEEAVRRHYDGAHLDRDCLTGVLQEFGYKRTAWVLANTIQQKEWDGRFSPRNRAWAGQTYIPLDQWHNLDFIVTTHPAILDGVVDQYHAAYQRLELFGPSHCEPDSFEKLDYEGKVLVLSPDTLKESCWSPQNQLWYAHDGFGCSPTAIGRSVRCTCLGDGEMTRWNRADFIGVLKEEFLPAWAEEKLMELKGQEQSDVSPAMGGMTME